MFVEVSNPQRIIVANVPHTGLLACNTQTSSSAIAETALQGGLVIAKSGRLEPGDNIYGHYTGRSIFNHYDVFGQQSNQIG